MAIPRPVIKLLDDESISYSLIAPLDKSLDAQGRIEVILLTDDIGRLVLLYPWQHMVDLKGLNARLGRELRACHPAVLAKLCREHGLPSFTGLPQLTGIPTIVENAIFRLPEVIMASGQEDELIGLSQHEFSRALSSATPLSITVPRTQANIKMNYQDNDVADITEAVKQFTSLRIKQRLDETIEIPPLPQTAQRVIKLRVNPDAEVRDLCEIVEADPSLAAQVVSWASSPYYAAPGKIRSINDAIVRVLGFDLVINLAIGLSLGKTIALPKDSVTGSASYWRQSAYMATAMEGLCKLIPAKERPIVGLCYLSGLLHNFGYLVLSHLFPPHFSLICRNIEVNPHIHHSEIERHHLGVCREQIAGWLMEVWGVPPEVVTALRFQNEPQHEGPHNQYSRLLYVAATLLRQQGIGGAGSTEVDPEVYAALNLKPERAENFIAQLMERSEQVEELSKALGHA